MRKIMILPLLGMLTLFGCTKTDVTVDAFNTSIQMGDGSNVNPVFWISGADVSFIVRSNHSSIRVISHETGKYDFGIVDGNTYSIDNAGFVVFTCRKINPIKEETVDILLVVEDPDTGARETLETSFHLFLKFGSSLRVNNLRQAKWQERDKEGEIRETSYPAIANGEDLSFTITTNLKRFTVVDFHCPFDASSVIVKGNSYNTDDDSNKTFVISKVHFGGDTAKLDSLHIIIRDEETRTDNTMTQKLVLQKNAAFKASVNEVLYPYSNDSKDNNITISIHGESPFDISSFRIESECRLKGNSALLSADSFRNITSGNEGAESKLVVVSSGDGSHPTYTPEAIHGNTISFRASDVEFDKSHDITIYMTVKDGPTQQETNFILTCRAKYEFKYATRARIYATDMEYVELLDKATADKRYVSYADGSDLGNVRGYHNIPFRLCNDKGEYKPVVSHKVKVHLLKSDKEDLIQFSASRNGRYSDEDMEYDPNASDLWIKGGDTEGEATLRISTQYQDHGNMYFDIPVHVRARVVMVVWTKYIDGYRNFHGMPLCYCSIFNYRQDNESSNNLVGLKDLLKYIPQNEMYSNPKVYFRMDITPTTYDRFYIWDGTTVTMPDSEHQYTNAMEIELSKDTYLVELSNKLVDMGAWSEWDSYESIGFLSWGWVHYRFVGFHEKFWVYINNMQYDKNLLDIRYCMYNYHPGQGLPPYRPEDGTIPYWHECNDQTPNVIAWDEDQNCPIL